MASFSTKRRVRHPASDMFALVADVESYPQFVPLCREMKVRRRTSGANGTEVLIAEMTVAYRMIRETFTSRVTLDRANSRILVGYLDGPFSHMENRWTFQPAGEDACDVEFYIAYEFRNRMLGLIMGTMFDTAFRRFAEAFERRADVVYSAGPA